MNMPPAGSNQPEHSKPTAPLPPPVRIDLVAAMADGLASDVDTTLAAERACAQCLESFARQEVHTRPDLAMVFISPHHIAVADRVAGVVARRLGPRIAIGVASETVIAGSTELESSPGISILAAALPGVELTPFSSENLPLALGEDDNDDDRLVALADATGMKPGLKGVILFADPFSTAIDRTLPSFAQARRLGAALLPPPGMDPSLAPAPPPILGGLASAASRPGGNALFMNERVLRSGLVGVSLGGPIRVDTVVSQGCRAFGPAMVVTAAKGQIIKSLSGRPALDMVQEAIGELSEDEREGLSRGLFLGLVIDEYRDRFGPGDYLIRGVIGVSKDGGAIAVADNVRVGQTVRLHLRDAQAAETDLALLMDAQALHERPLGALLITCNGRGTRLFNSPNHDAATIQHALADTVDQRSRPASILPATDAPPRRPIPLAGFFAAGEIGPVGPGLFLHGHTACAAIFRRG